MDNKLFVRITIILSILAIFIAFFSILNYGQGDNIDLISGIANNPNGQSARYTLLAVSRHSSVSDCWMVIAGKVYNVTNFINIHPGGDAMLPGCGKDATLLFETRPTGSNTPHSDAARKLLPAFYIGDL